MLGGGNQGGGPSSPGVAQAADSGSPPQAGGQPGGWFPAQRPSGSLWFARGGWKAIAVILIHKFRNKYALRVPVTVT